MSENLWYKSPIYWILLVDCMAFSLLSYYTGSLNINTMIAGVLVIMLIGVTYLVLVKYKLGDVYMFLVVSMLVSLGLIMIQRLDSHRGLKQVVWLFIGIGVFFATIYIFRKFHTWDRWIGIYAGASAFLYILTLVIGTNTKGATNWIRIGGFSFQPSELIKILFIFTLGCYYKHRDHMHDIWKNAPRWLEKPWMKRGVLALIAFSNLGFLVLQREWGTAVLFFLMYITFVYVFDSSFLFMLLNAAGAVAGAAGGYLYVRHVKIRVDIWRNPWADISDKGYQIAQSLFAIGSGGFFGAGLGMGSPQLIPEVNTDFIFSAICEEMGIFGGVAVIMLYFLLCYRGMKIVLKVQDMFLRVVALGITIMFGYQTFIIIGGVIKLIPLTGITLPFVSYGGSSLTTSFIALGILQAISGMEVQGGNEVMAHE